MSGFRLAAAQFPVSQPQRFAEQAALISAWSAEAVTAGARLLVYPEYASMSFSALLDPALQQNLGAQLEALQALREDYLALHRELAQRHGVYILAGSFPWQLDEACTVNRAFLCAPSGAVDWQDKQIMTRFERESWGVSSATEREDSGLKVFRTALGMLAVNICYDSEFPLLARAQCEAGAELLLVPSCTDTLGGYHRVRVGSQARALENQCYVAQAPLVGEAPWSQAVDVNVGAAAVYGPPDRGFPDDGVLGIGALNQPQWLYAEIDPAAVLRVRNEGQVFNHRHWHEQGAVELPPVKTVDLE